MTAWPGPILTDSGGFQVFSLAHRRKVTDQGVEFRSHIDGSSHVLTPERALDLQLGFGSDIIMPLDDVAGYDSDDATQRAAMERTHRWLSRAVLHWRQSVPDTDQRPLLFGIAQGGFDRARRRESAAFVVSHRLARRIGAWPSVLATAAVSGAAAALADRG